jgi:hypothetical protein
VIRQFTLENIKPFSINATYYGKGFIKTSKAREWALDIFYRLSTPENEQAFKDLREAFDPKKHGFTFHMTAYYPKSQFLTKQGHISNKLFDVSNVEKGLIDLFTLPKHALSPSPLGCQNLQIDDRYIVELQSRKKASESEIPYIVVQIGIVNL